jgi:small subunit ribosomal protein S8e
LTLNEKIKSLKFVVSHTLTVYHSDLHKRKRTGGKRRPYRGRRAFEMGGDQVFCTLGEKEVRIVSKARGGNMKYKLKRARYANVSVGEGKVVKSEILEVVENPANEIYRRRGIITKGAVIKTSAGLARVTSRPGADAAINAVLVEEIK